MGITEILTKYSYFIDINCCDIRWLSYHSIVIAKLNSNNDNFTCYPKRLVVALTIYIITHHIMILVSTNLLVAVETINAGVILIKA